MDKERVVGQECVIGIGNVVIRIRDSNINKNGGKKAKYTVSKLAIR